MSRNMGTTDRGARAFLVAPAALVAALILGAGTVAGIVLFVVAGIMLATSATGYCWSMACSTATFTATRSPAGRLRAKR